MSTLPEALINAIRELVRAHKEYTKQVEELSALGLNIRSELDRLVPCEAVKLADISLVGKGPVTLPNAILPQTHKIVPVTREADGAAS